eukprot:TRINITY_DN28179_c0_g1_i2.p1 TRINITY_DN28179_c0_g1~~TRINITY_DN28179_c0_g1_i2.p1  ORF type:complete len:2074 (+),score=726.61 TRINITY_DN28179_c0_g1_i2:1625-7846(+)
MRRRIRDEEIAALKRKEEAALRERGDKAKLRRANEEMAADQRESENRARWQHEATGSRRRALAVIFDDIDPDFSGTLEMEEIVWLTSCMSKAENSSFDESGSIIVDVINIFAELQDQLRAKGEREVERTEFVDFFESKMPGERETFYLAVEIFRDAAIRVRSEQAAQRRRQAQDRQKDRVRERKQTLATIFDAVDINVDGSLDDEELARLAQCLRELQHEAHEWLVLAFVGRGKVTERNEWCGELHAKLPKKATDFQAAVEDFEKAVKLMQQKLKREERLRRLAEVFDAMDLDNSGELDLEEVGILNVVAHDPPEERGPSQKGQQRKARDVDPSIIRIFDGLDELAKRGGLIRDVFASHFEAMLPSDDKLFSATIEDMWEIARRMWIEMQRRSRAIKVGNLFDLLDKAEQKTIGADELLFLDQTIKSLRRADVEAQAAAAVSGAEGDDTGDVEADELERTQKQEDDETSSQKTGGPRASRGSVEDVEKSVGAESKRSGSVADEATAAVEEAAAEEEEEEVDPRFVYVVEHSPDGCNRNAFIRRCDRAFENLGDWENFEELTSTWLSAADHVRNEWQRGRNDAIADVFDMLDFDLSGVLDAEELRRLGEAMEMKAQKAKEKLEREHLEKHGVANTNLFEAALGQRGEEFAEAEKPLALQIVQQLDTTADGSISRRGFVAQVEGKLSKLASEFWPQLEVITEGAKEMVRETRLQILEPVFQGLDYLKTGSLDADLMRRLRDELASSVPSEWRDGLVEACERLPLQTRWVCEEDVEELPEQEREGINVDDAKIEAAVMFFEDAMIRIMSVFEDSVKDLQAAIERAWQGNLKERLEALGRVFDKLDLDASGSFEAEEMTSLGRSMGRPGRHNARIIDMFGTLNEAMDSAPVTRVAFAKHFEANLRHHYTWGLVLEEFNRVGDAMREEMTRNRRMALSSVFDSLDVDATGKLNPMELVLLLGVLKKVGFEDGRELDVDKQATVDLIQGLQKSAGGENLQREDFVDYLVDSLPMNPDAFKYINVKLVDCARSMRTELKSARKEALRTIFEAMDTDRSGALDSSEVARLKKELCKRHENSSVEKDVLHMFSLLEKACKFDEVTCEDFIDIVEDHMPLDIDYFRAAFDELEVAVGRMKQELAKERRNLLNVVFDTLDLDKSGTIGRKLVLRLGEKICLLQREDPDPEVGTMKMFEEIKNAFDSVVRKDFTEGLDEKLPDTTDKFYETVNRYSQAASFVVEDMSNERVNKRVERRKIMATMYDELDVEGTGEVPASDINKLVKFLRDKDDLDLPPSRIEEIARLMKKLDDSGDGQVDFGEFVELQDDMPQDHEEFMHEAKILLSVTTEMQDLTLGDKRQDMEGKRRRKALMEVFDCIDLDRSGDADLDELRRWLEQLLSDVNEDYTWFEQHLVLVFDDLSTQAQADEPTMGRFAFAQMIADVLPEEKRGFNDCVSDFLKAAETCSRKFKAEMIMKKMEEMSTGEGAIRRQQLAAVFDELDFDGSGELDFEEFQKLAEAMYRYSSSPFMWREEAVREMFADMDTSGGGGDQVDRPEFINYMYDVLPKEKVLFDKAIAELRDAARSVRLEEEEAQGAQSDVVWQRETETGVSALQMHKERRKILAAVFDFIDVDLSGVLDEAEFMKLGRALRRHSDASKEWTDEKNRAMFHKLDKTDDGEIQRSEFVFFFDEKLPLSEEAFLRAIGEFMEAAFHVRLEEPEADELDDSDTVKRPYVSKDFYQELYHTRLQLLADVFDALDAEMQGQVHEQAFRMLLISLPADGRRTMQENKDLFNGFLKAVAVDSMVARRSFIEYFEPMLEERMEDFTLEVQELQSAAEKVKLQQVPHQKGMDFYSEVQQERKEAILLVFHRLDGACRGRGYLEAEDMLRIGQALRLGGVDEGKWDKDINSGFMARIDTTGDGRIEAQEFVAYFDSKLPRGMEAFYNRLADFEAAARDIRAAELEEKRRLARERALFTVFAFLDMDGDGGLVFDEFMHLGRAMRRHGGRENEWTVERNQAMFDKMDIGRDGMVDRYEFTDYFLARLPKEMDAFLVAVGEFMEAALHVRSQERLVHLLEKVSPSR